MRFCVNTINMRTTHELLEKFYRVHACLVHASVKFKLSCTILYIYVCVCETNYLGPWAIARLCNCETRLFVVHSCILFYPSNNYISEDIFITTMLACHVATA